jgi:hypothetical protein
VSTSFAIRKTRTFEKDAGKSSFIPRTTKRWNELPVDIRNSVNNEELQAESQAVGQK